MQAKNHILINRFFKRSSRPRKGFALLTATFVLIIISAMLTIMLSQTTATAQKTVNDYLYEQAVLLAYSATELAVLRLSQQNHAAGCATTLPTVTYPSSTSPMFTITTTVEYIWSAADAAALPASCSNYISTLNTAESSGAAHIDVTVTSDANLNLSEPIRFHRRTLQKL